MKTFSLNKDLLTDSGLPEAFWALGADTYQGDAKALRLVHRYSNEQCAEILESGLGLFITGEAQSCKTFLLTYALRCLMTRGIDVRYAAMEELTEQFFAKDGQFRQSVYAPKIMAVDAIEIVGRNSEDLVLDQIVRIRKDCNRPLLLATTMPLAEFEQHFKKSTVAYIRNSLVAVKTKVDPIRMEAIRRKRLKGFDAE